MQYTENKKFVRASFKDCLIADRKEFINSNCIVPISVGQSVHENDKFLAVVRLINSSFKECTILIDDSVQRHTMKISSQLDDDALYKLAISEGDAWIARNSNIYNQLDIPHKILRWDDWLNDRRYKDSQKTVWNFYTNNDAYKAEVDANISEFLSRYKDIHSNINFEYKEAFNYCLDYLIEECAAMCLWAENGYDFEVYPTGRNRAMAATHELLISLKHPNKLKSVSIRFKKHKSDLLSSINW